MGKTRFPTTSARFNEMKQVLRIPLKEKHSTKERPTIGAIPVCGVAGSTGISAALLFTLLTARPVVVEGSN